MLEHRGIRWGYVFLKSANHLQHDHFEDLMVQAVEMYLAGEDTREVKHSEFQGRLFTERRYEVIGGLEGRGSTPSWKRPMARTPPRSWLMSKPVHWRRAFPRTDGCTLPLG